MMQLQKPEAIASESFAIIRRHLQAAGHTFAPHVAAVIERIIHSQGDFEFATLTHTSPAAIDAGLQALRGGCPIVTDVQMVRIGINAQRVAALGCQVYCFVNDADIQERATRVGTTRSAMGMQIAAERGFLAGAIVAIGNAPTALHAVLHLMDAAGVRPALIIGVPVGFVGTAESKAALMEVSTVPWLVTTGTKGGSTVAVAVVNALLRLAMDELSTDI